MWSLLVRRLFLTTFYGLYFNHHYTLTYTISERPLLAAFHVLNTEGDILMICPVCCIHFNINWNQKNPLPCQDFNPHPP